MPTVVVIAALTGLASIAVADPIAAQMWPVAGNGPQGYTGDGGPALDAELNQPWAVATTSVGGYLIADRLGNVIRKVSAAGTITTVAGTGTAGYSGDGGAATSATLNAPRSVVALPGGGYLIADSGNNVIREVSAAGVITTVAGTGTAGYTGDGGQAINAELNLPTGIAATADGGFLIADSGNSQVKWVVGPGAGPTGPAGPAGTPGQTGPAGANGKVELVSCRTVTVTVTTNVHGKSTRHKVDRRHCSTQLVTGTVRFTAAEAHATRVQLRRAGRTVARGSVARRNGRVWLLLRAQRALAPGRYTLVLTGLRHGHRTITRTSIAVR